MTALIVIFITLSLMGSALWVLPSKRDRQRMNLRMQARKLGLVVQLTSIDLPDKWDKSTERYKVVAYSLYRVKALTLFPDVVWLLPYKVWKYQKVGAGWWLSEQVELSDMAVDMLTKYSDIITGIKITPESVSLFWHESADEGVLVELSELIQSLASIKNIAN